MRLVARVLLGLLGLLVSILLGRRLAQRWQRARFGRPAVPLAAALLAPERLLPRLPLEPGMRVLIVGPASPRLVQAVARAAGKYGRVYVLEPTGQRAQRLPPAPRTSRCWSGALPGWTCPIARSTWCCASVCWPISRSASARSGRCTACCARAGTSR